jgi:signal transduction histidine kinase
MLGSSGTDDLPLDVLWEDGERIFCRTWRVDAHGERIEIMAIRSSKAEPDGVLISIQDSGPGIDPTKLDRIFDAFYTTKPDGLGMGLSVCRTIVEAHGESYGRRRQVLMVPSSN